MYDTWRVFEHGGAGDDNGNNDIIDRICFSVAFSIRYETMLQTDVSSNGKIDLDNVKVN